MTSVDFFEPILSFANFDPKNDDQMIAISAIFGPSPIVLSEKQGKRWLLRAPTVDWLQMEEMHNDQTLLRILLDMLSRKGPTPEFWEEVSILIGSQANLTGKAMFADFPGGLIADIEIAPDSLGQWYGFALAELISQKLADCVRRCELQTCGDFFLAVNKQGPKRRFCSTNHGSQARVARARKRAKR